MSFNVVSLVMQHLGPEVVARIARALGLESHLASRAIGALVPGMLGSLLQATSTPVGAAHLAGVLDSIDPGSLGAMAGSIGGANQATLVGSGNALVGLALGGPASDALASSFSRFSGLDGLSSNALTGIVGTSVLGSLAAVKRSQGLDSAGLGSVLAGQIGNIQAALPAGFTGGFNVGPAGTVAGDRSLSATRQPAAGYGAPLSVRAAEHVAAPIAARGFDAQPTSSRGWLWMIPVGALIVGSIWYFANSSSNARRLVAEQQRVATEKIAADAKAKAEAEARAKAEAEAQLRAAAEARAKIEAERSKAEAEAKARAEAEAKQRAEAEARLKAEAEAAKARADAEAAQKARLEAETKAKAEAEARQRAEVDAMTAKQRADAEAAAKVKADADAAAVKARADADLAAAKARADADAAAAKIRADADAAAAATAKARADAETKARTEAEAKRLADAEAAAAKARAEAEAKARLAAAVPAPPATPPVAAPATVAVAKACEADIKQLIASGSIRFRIASATIQPDSAATLNRIAAAINGCQGTKVRVEGHTDSDGDEQENLQLSDRRAKSVQDFLTKAGVPADRLSAVGLGQGKPIATNDSAENKLKNRRTEIIVDPK